MTLSIIPVMKRRMIRMRRRSRSEQRRRGKLLLIKMEMEMVRETMKTLERRRMTRRNMMMTISRQRTQPTREKRSKMAGKFLRLKHMMF